MDASQQRSHRARRISPVNRKLEHMLTLCLHRIHFSARLIKGPRVVQVETEIKKWGNSLALRVSGIMAELPQFEPGTRVTVEVSADGLIVRRASGQSRKYQFPFTESELLDGITPESAHAEALADPSGTELGL